MSEQIGQQVKHAADMRVIHNAILKGDDSGLSVSQKDYKELLRDAFTLLLIPSNTESSAAKELETQHLIEPLRAVRIISDAKRMFGDVVSTNRQADAHIAYMRAEWVWAQAVEQYDKSTTTTARLEALETANRALNTAVKIRGLDKDLPEGFDPSKTEPHKYEITLPADLEKALIAMTEKGSVNLNDFIQTAPVQDVTPQ